MQTQEWIVGWLSIRADGLEETIWGMLADPKERLGPLGRTWEQIRKIFKRYVPDTEEDESPWLQPLDEADEGSDRQIIADQLTFYQGRVAQIEAQLEDAPAETRAQLEAELTDTQAKIDEYRQLLGA
jgi:hypothetical protein